MKKLLLFLFGLMLLGSHAIANAESISRQTVSRWLQVGGQKITIGAIKPIQLISGEKAFIAALMFPNKPRNFWAGYALVRPKHKQARVIQHDNLGGQYNGIEIETEDYGKASIVKLGGAGSGQGTMGESRTLVVFDDWKVRTLFHADTLYSNTGACGYGNACEETHGFINVLTANPLTIVHTTVSGAGKDAEHIKYSRPKARIIKP